MNKQMSPEQAQTINEFKALLDESFSDTEKREYRKDIELIAKTMPKLAEILERLSFAQQNEINALLEQQTLGMEWNEFKQTGIKLDYFEKGKTKEYAKELADKRKKLKHKFKDYIKYSIEREVLHKELERRLGFEFELGRNPYMISYVAYLCFKLDKEVENVI